MTYKAYLDNIQEQTGKSPQDFIQLADKKGFLKPGVKAGDIVAWLKKDFSLGHGHAMAIVLLLRQASGPMPTSDDKISKQFSGARAHWRKAYDGLLSKIDKFGPDVSVDPTDTYISLLRNKKKFAVVQVSSDRMDLGIKLKGIPAKGRFEKSGTWNQMVTHRVRLKEPRQIDAELLSWLRQAYDKA